MCAESVDFAPGTNLSCSIPRFSVFVRGNHPATVRVFECAAGGSRPTYQDGPEAPYREILTHVIHEALERS